MMLILVVVGIKFILFITSVGGSFYNYLNVVKHSPLFKWILLDKKIGNLLTHCPFPNTIKKVERPNKLTHKTEYDYVLYDRNGNSLAYMQPEYLFFYGSGRFISICFYLICILLTLFLFIGIVVYWYNLYQFGIFPLCGDPNTSVLVALFEFFEQNNLRWKNIITNIS